jgi:hypothetical protein
MSDNIDIGISIALGIGVFILGIRPQIIFRTDEARKQYRYLSVIMAIGGPAMVLFGIARLLFNRV